MSVLYTNPFFRFFLNKYDDVIVRYRVLYLLFFNLIFAFAFLVRLFFLLLSGANIVYIIVDCFFVFIVLFFLYLLRKGKLDLLLALHFHFYGILLSLLIFIFNINRNSVYINEYFSFILFLIYVLCTIIVSRKRYNILLFIYIFTLNSIHCYFLIKRGYEFNDIIIYNAIIFLGYGMSIFIQLFSNKFITTFYEQEKKNNELITKNKIILENEQKYKMLAENSLDYIFLIDIEDNMLYANKHLIDLLNLDISEIIGKKRGLLFPANNEDLFLKNIHEVVESKKSLIFDEVVKWGDKKFYLNVQLNPIINGNNEVESVMGITRDISYLKKCEEELININKIKDEFISNVSHEIRNPINVIAGLSEVIEKTDLTGTQRNYVEIIRNTSIYLLSLVNDILDYSKMEAGKFEVIEEILNVEDLVAGIKKIFSISADEKNILFSCVIEEDVPRSIISDRLRLMQILTNLTSNAIKFTQSGYVTITCQLEKEGYIKFSVADSGIGIEKDKIKFLFDKFNQVHDKTIRRYSGTGLGLAISKKLVELMGGQIGVTSIPRNGSTFYFTIPLIIPTNIMIKNNKIDRIIKILLADDEVLNQKYFLSIMEDENFQIITVDNGAKVIEKYKSDNFDMIILDLNMPLMNGFETAKAIRLIENENYHIPIIALTGSFSLDSKELSIDAGFDECLIKPVKKEQILSVINRLII